MNVNKENETVQEQQEKKQAQSEAVIGLLTNRGILPDAEIDNEKVREARKEKQKNTYHNTMMLLQHYRTIVWLLECFPERMLPVSWKNPLRGWIRCWSRWIWRCHGETGNWRAGWRG